jgi:hypothetical protein
MLLEVIQTQEIGITLAHDLQGRLYRARLKSLGRRRRRNRRRWIRR